MSHRIMNAVEDLAGRLLEKLIDAAEFVCPPLKKFLSWEFADDGSLFAIHDEDEVSSPRTKTTNGYTHLRSPSFKESGRFAQHAAAGAA